MEIFGEGQPDAATAMTSQSNRGGTSPTTSIKQPHVILYMESDNKKEEDPYPLYDMDGSYGRLDIDSVQLNFRVAIVLLDGEEVSTDKEGFSIQRFRHGTRLRVTGGPASSCVASPYTVTLQLDGQPDQQQCFRLYNITEEGGRVSMDEVSRAYGYRVVIFDGLFASTQRGTGLSLFCFQPNEIVAVAGVKYSD